MVECRKYSNIYLEEALTLIIDIQIKEEIRIWTIGASSIPKELGVARSISVMSFYDEDGQQSIMVEWDTEENRIKRQEALYLSTIKELKEKLPALFEVEGKLIVF